MSVQHRECLDLVVYYTLSLRYTKSKAAHIISLYISSNRVWNIVYTMLPQLESLLLVSLLAIVMAATPPNVVLFLVDDVGVYFTSIIVAVAGICVVCVD